MADVENRQRTPHGDRSVEVRVSAQLENLAVVRTVVAPSARSRTSTSMRCPTSGSRWTRRVRD